MQHGADALLPFAHTVTGVHRVTHGFKVHDALLNRLGLNSLLDFGPIRGAIHFQGHFQSAAFFFCPAFHRGSILYLHCQRKFRRPGQLVVLSCKLQALLFGLHGLELHFHQSADCDPQVPAFPFALAAQ